MVLQQFKSDDFFVTVRQKENSHPELVSGT